MMTTPHLTKCICVRHDISADNSSWTVWRNEVNEAGELEGAYQLLFTVNGAEALSLAKELGRKQGLPVLQFESDGDPVVIQQSDRVQRLLPD